MLRFPAARFRVVDLQRVVRKIYRVPRQLAVSPRKLPIIHSNQGIGYR